MQERPLRPGVVGVVLDAQGRLLVGERARQPGTWQLPQGGIERGETPEQALLREMREEIGTDRIEILARSVRPISYRFPEPILRQMRWSGQSQIWFLLRLREGEQPSLEASDGEFIGLAWHTLDAVIEQVISWKREAYESGLSALGLRGGLRGESIK